MHFRAICSNSTTNKKRDIIHNIGFQYFVDYKMHASSSSYILSAYIGIELIQAIHICTAQIVGMSIGFMSGLVALVIVCVLFVAVGISLVVFVSPLFFQSIKIINIVLK